MQLDISDARAVASLPAAICIIGAGAAGITLACELDGYDFPVLLVDVGFSQNTDTICRGLATGGHAPPNEFRRMGFGGTTSIWGGRCVPFDEVDFELRSHVSNSGWPISYDDVARYYPRALRYCQAGECDFSVNTSLADPLPIVSDLSNADGLIADRLERYSPPTNFGLIYRDAIARSKNVTAVSGLRCIRLIKAPCSDRIEFAEFADRSGQLLRIRSDLFVVSAGGIETVRLLFDSDTVGAGLGNRYDCLGRFYSCHFENICARLVPGEARIAFGFEKTLDGVYARRKLLFTSQAQRDHNLLNCTFRLHFPDYSDARHGSSVMSLIYLAKLQLIPEYQKILARSSSSKMHISSAASHLRNIVGGTPELASFAVQQISSAFFSTRRIPYTLVAAADGSYPLELNSEQTPLWHSRITPMGSPDQHGVHDVLIDWKIANSDILAAGRAFSVLRDTFAKTAHCRIEFDEGELLDTLSHSRPVGGHHIGGTRMAGSPRRGVVDQDCRIFGLSNCFISSSSTFSTSSHANPTLTIVAMAVRLAGHLGKLQLGTVEIERTAVHALSLDPPIDPQIQPPREA